ncbi:MAG: GNAT family N-acetyltransferase, partial [Chloroflexi bacterium]|nr:GNAT family N-acetyltransferase [Chloroflexota bacterium]
MKMIIREAAVADAQAILRLHTRSVLTLCRADYTTEQLEGWVSNSTLEKYQFRLKKHRAYVAEQDGNTAGYVRWNPATNELCSIFVDPDYVRQGVATKLMATACEDAISHGVEAFWLDASLTAVPFYKAIG